MNRQLKKLIKNSFIVYDYSEPPRKKKVVGCIVAGGRSKELLITFEGKGWPKDWKWYFLDSYKFNP